jgi:transposase
MWLTRGGPNEHKIVRYRYAPGRGSEHAKRFLKDWNGFLQTDGYSAYKTALAGTQITHVGCWAHARRKFVEAEKVAPSELTKDALGRIRKLYELEKTAREDAKKSKLTDEVLDRC